MQANRVAIWSVLEDDHRWYAGLFPALWLIGTLYHGYFWFVTRPVPDWSWNLAISEFIQDIGFVGLASAILALMIVAARRLVMALFDWGNKDKTRAEAIIEYKQWLVRKQAAERDGRRFTEPEPTGERKKQPA